jgi:two-component system nitrate/nitrite response regulator NarL
MGEDIESVLIVDDDVLFGDALRSLLLEEGVHEVAVALTLSDAYQALDSKRWDVVLLELEVAGEDAMQFAMAARTRSLRTKVLVLSDEAKPHWIRAVSRSGLHGFLTKDVTPLHLMRSLRSAQAGTKVASASPRRRKNLSDNSIMPSFMLDQLTKREREILALLVEGLDGNQIAKLLGIAPHTVRTHVQNTLAKLQVHSRLEAAAVAIKHGFADRRDYLTG